MERWKKPTRTFHQVRQWSWALPDLQVEHFLAISCWLNLNFRGEHGYGFAEPYNIYARYFPFSKLSWGAHELNTVANISLTAFLTWCCTTRWTVWRSTTTGEILWIFYSDATRWPRLKTCLYFPVGAAPPSQESAAYVPPDNMSWAHIGLLPISRGWPWSIILRLVLVSRILNEIWARIPLPHMYSTYRSYVDQICAVIAQTYAQDQNLNWSAKIMLNPYLSISITLKCV